MLAIDVTWEDASFFEYLQCQKAIAQEEEKETAVFLGDRESGEGLLLAIKPYGGKGYEWILQGHDYTLIIGNWLEPKTRPSIMAQIHSGRSGLLVRKQPLTVCFAFSAFLAQRFRQ
ncbi:MAG: hypothetical protein WC256_14035 [Desulfurivibrionaceae bacterium]